MRLVAKFFSSFRCMYVLLVLPTHPPHPAHLATLSPRFFFLMYARRAPRMWRILPALSIRLDHGISSISSKPQYR